VRDQRSLRRPGRAAGVDEDRGIVGLGLRGGEPPALCRERLYPVDVALPCRRADGHHRRQLRAERPRGDDVGDAAFVDDRQAHLAVVDAVLERVGAEQHRQRHRNRAEAIQRNVRDRGLEALRQDERDAIAAPDTELAQRGGKPVGVAVELAVAEVGARSVLGLEADRDRAGPLLRPARAANVGDVEVGRHVPAKAGVQLGVAIDAVSHAADRRTRPAPGRRCGRCASRA
jgi:hypothetical protein